MAKKLWNDFWSQRPKDISSQNDFVFQELSNKVICKFVPDNSKVLIAGCGDGYNTNKFVEKGCNVTGVDFSINAIEKAKSKYPSSKFYVEDLEFMTDYNTYDVIICERVFANLYTRERQYIVIDNMINALKPNGLLIITDPTIQGYESINPVRKKSAPIPKPGIYHILQQSFFVCRLFQRY